MPKDQVWNIISFFHTKRPKNFFPEFSRPENDQTFFHAFQDSIVILHLSWSHQGDVFGCYDRPLVLKVLSINADQISNAATASL